MTIPILPGPFGFIKGAADAGLDAYYRAQQRKDMLDQIKRQQDLQNTSMFMQMLQSGMLQPQSTPDIQFPGMAVPGMGVIPPAQIPAQTSYDMPGGVGESFQRLGFGQPKFSKPPGLKKAESDVRVAEGTEQPAIRGAVAGATIEEGKAAQITAENDKWLPILQGLTPQQIMQQRGVMSPEVAELADKVAFEKLQTEMAAQDPTRQSLKVQGMIQESLLRRLPKDPNMQLLAGHAALGTLGYLIAGLQQSGDTNRMSIQANREKINTLNQITLTARQLLTKKQAEWDEGRQLASNSYEIQGAPEKKKGKMMQDAINLYESNTPKPNADEIFSQVQEQFGWSPEEFKQVSRTLAGLIGAPPEQAKQDPQMQSELDAETKSYNERLASGKYDAGKLKTIYDSQIAKIKAKYAKP